MWKVTWTIFVDFRSSYRRPLSTSSSAGACASATVPGHLASHAGSYRSPTASPSSPWPSPSSPLPSSSLWSLSWGENWGKWLNIVQFYKTHKNACRRIFLKGSLHRGVQSGLFQQDWKWKILELLKKVDPLKISLLANHSINCPWTGFICMFQT